MTNTTDSTDLPPYYADLPHDGPYERAVAATVATGLLSQLRPFRTSTTLMGSTTHAPLEPSGVTLGVVDLAEWVMSGLHPLTNWAEDTEPEEET